MNTLSILLQAGWQGWANSVRSASEERRKKIAEILGFLVLVVALYLLGRSIFDVAKTQLGDAYRQTILQAVNLFMVFGVFILAKDAMEDSIKQLYEDSDTSLLLSLPLSPATVFGFKLIQLIASNLLSMAIWLFPPWVAFGQIFHLPWGFYATLIPVCLALLIIIISEVVIVMMLIVRFFSSRRMIQVLKTLGTIIGVGAGFLLSMSFFALDESDQIAQFLLSHLKAPTSDWYPHLWATKLMISWLPGADIHPLRWALQLSAASAIVPIFGVLLASRVYGRSWEYARRVEAGTRQRKRRYGPSVIFGRGKIRSMMAKDFLVFIRHKGRITMIVMLSLILLIVMFGAVYETQKDGGGAPGIHLPLFGLGVQIMIYSVMITFGLTWGGFKAEAQTWWLLKSGPISPESLFNSKFLTATLCSVTYTNIWILFGLILFRVHLWVWLPILLTTTMVTAAAVAFNTAIGALPWMAEIGKTDRNRNKRPVLRVLTIISAMIGNMILLIGPPLILEVIVLKEGNPFAEAPRAFVSTIPPIFIGVTLIVLTGVWWVSYLLGKRLLRKLLYA